MEIKTISLVLTIALLPVLASCKSAAGPEGTRAIGIIELVSETDGAQSSDILTPVITAPDTVQAGVTFEATITTIGLSSSCWHAAGAEISLEPQLAIVVPYDRNEMRIREDIVCTGDSVELPRTIQLRFTRAGQAVLRVDGRKVIGGSLLEAVAKTVEKQIIVVP